MTGPMPLDPSLTVSCNVMVPMRDGVRLATDIYRPSRPDGEAQAGPFPVILVRTSYDKSSGPMVVEPVAKFFTRHGYAVALQDLRGRGQSEGIGQYFHVANPAEGQDGHDTIEWIAAQPWCCGAVGMVGSSHLGIVQNVAALHRPPHLKAIWADVAPIKTIDGMSREGGAMSLHMWGAMFLHGYDAQEIRDDPVARARIEATVENLRGEVLKAPFKPGAWALASVPALEQTVTRYYRNGTYDDWWAMEAQDLTRHVGRFADIPVTLSSGWYDPFVRDVIWQFTRLRQQNQSPVRLVLGPWNHGGMRSGLSHFGEVDFGSDAPWGAAVYGSEQLRWFDRWLKGERTGVEDEPPVRMFVMGGGTGRRTQAGHLDHGGRWRTEANWPPAGVSETDFWLTAEGVLALVAPQPTSAALRWTHDPDHPVPTIGAAVTGFLEWVKIPEGMDPTQVTARARMRSIVVDGPMHQRERPDLVAARAPYPLLAERPDVLVFQTEPLAEDVEVSGAPVVTLHVASTAVDVDITVKLLDIHPPTPEYPEGFHMNLCDTILRMRFRGGLDSEEMMNPGHIYAVTLTLPAISNRFKAGNRIRLDVASSNFPRFDVNPCTGEPLGRHSHTIKALNTIWADRERPSKMTLPIVT